jgi:hypothetical protein
MSGILLVSFIAAAYWLITAPRRGKRPPVRDAAYFHSSGFSQGRSHFDLSVLKGARLWKR